jgi:hypothetical protein
MVGNAGEKRKAVRRPTDRAAKICHDPTGLELHCRVLDISERGARLAFSHHPPKDLPHHLVLQTGPDGCVKWNCEVIWTESKSIGVKFDRLTS